jgi:hypothetical protein
VTACEAETDFPPSEADNTQFCGAKSWHHNRHSSAPQTLELEFLKKLNNFTVIEIAVTKTWKKTYKQSGESSLMTFSALSMARRSSFLTASDLFSALVICKWLACRSVLCRQEVLTVTNKQFPQAFMSVDTCAWTCSTIGLRNKGRLTEDVWLVGE